MTSLAASNNRPVGIIDILRSVRNENIKNGKVILGKDFGVYEEVMEKADKIILDVIKIRSYTFENIKFNQRTHICAFIGFV